MNYVALQDECLNYGFSSTAYRARVARWLNEGYDVLQRRHGLKEQEQVTSVTATPGTGVVAVSGAFELDRIVSCVLTGVDPAPLEPIERHAYDELPSDTTGRPTQYAVLTSAGDLSTGFKGFSLLLWPVPDSAYVIGLIFSRIYSMTADTDIPDRIPPNRHDVLVHYAVSKAYLSEDDPEMARVHMDMFNRQAAEIATSRKHPVQDGPVQVPGTWGA